MDSVQARSHLLDERGRLQELVRAAADDQTDEASEREGTPGQHAADQGIDTADWLDDHDVQGAWDVAPVFVAAGADVDWLDELAENVSEDVLSDAVHWIAYALDTEQLMNEIEAEIGGTVREILVNNGEPVEYGQTLFTIE